MRLVCAMLGLVAALHAAPNVTLVLQFDETYSPKSIDAMEREVTSIVGKSIKLDWRLISDVRSSDAFESLMVVHFHGACIMQPVPYLIDERGYYAYTHVSDGKVLPFSEVECDKIASSIQPEISKSQWHNRDSILGRAMGRVLAHELYHMLAKSQHHSDEGVTKSALSPAALISNKLKMSRADLGMLK
jgi:hypothetical protein